uniref:Transmembrane protein n=1 Tax=Parastrongyloides trichosuri TaxID=131310 RepID=A0A0N4ZS10_PARTI
MFTDKLQISNITSISIQLENRQIEIEDATLYVIPYRNLIEIFLSEFPIISYAVLFVLSFMSLILFFLFIWVRRINQVMKEFDMMDKEKDSHYESTSTKTTPLQLNDKKENVDNSDDNIPDPPNCELHECTSFETIPGWNIDNKTYLKESKKDV